MSWHVVPEDEQGMHVASLACPCMPVMVPDWRPDGTWGLIVDHCDDEPVMKIRTRSDDG